jgi:hypothetical protein
MYEFVLYYIFALIHEQVVTLTGNLSSLQVTFTTSSKPTTPSVSFWATDIPTKLAEILAASSDIHTFTHPSTGAIDCILYGAKSK